MRVEVEGVRVCACVCARVCLCVSVFMYACIHVRICSGMCSEYSMFSIYHAILYTRIFLCSHGSPRPPIYIVYPEARQPSGGREDILHPEARQPCGGREDIHRCTHIQNAQIRYINTHTVCTQTHTHTPSTMWNQMPCLGGRFETQTSTPLSFLRTGSVYPRQFPGAPPERHPLQLLQRPVSKIQSTISHDIISHVVNYTVHSHTIQHNHHLEFMPIAV